MQTINTLVRSVQIIAVIIVVLLAIFGAVGFYFMKIHRSRIQEKHLDYSQFKRLDSLEYVKFDDVGEHMVRNCRKITAQISKPFMMYDHP